MPTWGGHFVIPRLIVHVANHCTEFKVSSLNNSWIILWGLRILKWFTWCDHAPFQDGLLTIGWDLLWSTCTHRDFKFGVQVDRSKSTCTPNLKSLCVPIMKIWKAMQNVDIGVVSATQPFHRVHITCYETFTETMHLSCTIFKSKVADFNLPTCIWHPRWGNPIWILPIFGIRKLESIGYHVALFVWS